MAVVVAYEGFDYPNATALLHNQSGGAGWVGGWIDSDQDMSNALTRDDISLTSAAFTFAAVGDRISVVGASEAIRMMGTTFDMAQDGTELYGSFSVRKASDGGTTNDAVELRLTSNLTSTEAFRVGIGSSESLFIDSGAVATSGVEVLTPGDTLYFVFKIVSAAAGGDQFFASVFDPTETVPATEPAVWDAMHTEAVSHVFNGVRLQTGSSVVGTEFDEIRIGDTWEDVTAVTSYELGDFNNSTTIDPGDLDALLAGLYVGNTYQEGDIDLNGVVDLRDFNAFREIYLNAGFSLAGYAPAPEPGAVLLLCWAAILSTPRRRCG
ncbi:MAG: hypothetical protein KDA37_04080 [Planctomycetales bacterium]|nr:hypothetical protein [Planctomycetales bacterium]